MMTKDIVLTPERAAIIGKTAIISDLHIGIENVLQERGVAIPRIQIDEIIRNVKNLIDKYHVNRLVIAGDFKHEFSKNLPYELEDIKRFIESIDVEISVVRGNHDNFLAGVLKEYGIELKEYIRVGGYYVVHGHKEVNFERVIMGHEHPAVKVRVRGGVYTYPCFLIADNRVVVLPAFSPLASGNNILQGFISPMLKNAKRVDVFGVSDNEVLYLGCVEDLKAVIQSIL